MATLLIVEDCALQRGNYKLDLQKHNILEAHNIASAQTLFEKFKNSIDIVVFDGHLKNGKENETTLKFAFEIKKAGFNGPMIAASSDIAMRYTLVKEGGCNYSIRESKSEVPEIIHLILSKKQDAY